MIKLKGQIHIPKIRGTIYRIAGEGSGGPLQAKTVYPSHDEQIIAPDEDYYGLVSVTVKGVPKLPFASAKFFEGFYIGENTVEKVINLDVSTSVESEKVIYAYYRLTITDFRRSGSKVNYANMAELTLYDANGNNIVTNAMSAEYSASSVYSSKYASNAFDGSTSTLWESDYSGAPSYTNWIQVKMRGASTVASFGITPRPTNFNDFPYAFTLAQSDDGETWETIAEYNGLSSGWSMGVERILSLTE